jgi:hypothetical protein
VSGSYDTAHCHGLADIAGYIVVRARPGAARTDLAFLEGARQYLAARDQVRGLAAGPGPRAGGGDEFWVDVVYTDGCRTPW